MNKATLVEIVAESAGIKKKEADLAVSAVFAAIQNELATGGRVQIAGFGTFRIKERSARIGRNPRTNEAIEIPASKNPSFTPGKAFKELVNK